MAFVKKIQTEAGSIGIWEFTEQVEELRKLFSFTAKEKEEFDAIKSEKRKKEFLVVRLLLENLTGNKPNINYTESGKPYLKEVNQKISISHSAELATVFISEKNVGIDVENMFRNTQKVAGRFLSGSELSAISKGPSPDLKRIIYWSAKEAIFKCTLQNGVVFNKQIQIHPFKLLNHENFTGQLETKFGIEFFDLGYFFYGNNVVVFCVER